MGRGEDGGCIDTIGVNGFLEMGILLFFCLFCLFCFSFPFCHLDWDGRTGPDHLTSFFSLFLTCIHTFITLFLFLFSIFHFHFFSVFDNFPSAYPPKAVL